MSSTAPPQLPPRSHRRRLSAIWLRRAPLEFGDDGPDHVQARPHGLAPCAQRDWTWLREIACDRDLDAYPKPRFDRIVTSERLVKAGLDLIRTARQNPRLRKHWRATMRNGLMVALLGQVPIRLKNLVNLSSAQLQAHR